MQTVVIGQTYVVRTFRRGRKFLPLAVLPSGKVSGIFLDGGHTTAQGIVNDCNANIRRKALQRDTLVPLQSYLGSSLPTTTPQQLRKALRPR